MDELLRIENLRVVGAGAARVAYVAQSAAAAFNPAHRIGDQIVEAAVRHGTLVPARATAEARRLCAKLGLPDPERFGDRYPHQVSGGQLQRAMTVMAMVAPPDLIVFDEPTTALDVTTQIEVLAAIKDAIRDEGMAALCITHDLALVAQDADRVMVLKDGRPVEEGPTGQILLEPKQAHTRALVNVRRVGGAAKGPSDPMPVLEVRGVGAAYGEHRVLDGVTLHVDAGRTVAVVGESGSGKSTLARVITGLLPPLAGETWLKGDRLPATLAGRSKDQLRRVRLIHQMPDTAFNPRHTVEDIVGRPLGFYFGPRGPARRRRVAELPAEVELPAAFAGRLPAELSGGQKQRVGIARALAAGPELLIRDGVTSALDAQVADGVLRLLLRLQAETGVAYLFITHDLAAVRAIADDIVVMHRGRVVQQGRKDEVLTPPRHPCTDLLLSSAPEMELGWLDRTLAERAARQARGERVMASADR